MVARRIPFWWGVFAGCWWTLCRGEERFDSFRTSILPVLTQAGCNAGACHGAATGQGGFKLSLLGYDPELDYQRITRERGARRVHLGEPDASLILQKPSGVLDHEGGKKLRRDTPGYRRLRDWISRGAPFGPSELKTTRIQVTPEEILFADRDPKALLKVVAEYSDGSKQEVSEWALYTSNDEGVADVSKSGEVRPVGGGLTSIMVRYSGQVAAARVAAPVGKTRVSATDFPSLNFIDEAIRAELDRLGVPPSGLSSAEEFLRRVFLDLTGRLPEVEQATAFLNEQDGPERRRALVEELLRSEAFVDFWTLKLGDLLMIQGTGPEAAAYHQWVRDWVRVGGSFADFARGLLTASGPLNEVGPANFFTLANDPRDLSEHASRIFLGVQLGCARCHAHPTDRWTQEDYHSFAAYFARVRRETGRITTGDQGEVDDPRSGKPALPRPLEEATDVQTAGASSDRREDLAGWLARPENPMLARAFVNRVWKQLMGRGLVEPVDDLRPTNPSTHPALMDQLVREAVDTRLDLRSLIRLLVNSRTYQLTSQSRPGNAEDRQLYSHALLKPLSGPVFADAVAQVTGVDDEYEGYPAGTRAVQLRTPSTPAPALDALGRCARKRGCETGGSGGGLAHALHLINGSTIQGKLGGARVMAWAKRADDEWVKELYLRAFSRVPRTEEREAWRQELAARSDRVAAVQDLVWAVLNSREFGFNH